MAPRAGRRSAAAAFLLLLGAASGQAQPRSRADCEAAYPASRAQAGKDVVWLASYDAVVTTMLSMAKVTPQDLVLDLGAGDGRIAIAAAKAPYGARAVGIEYDANMAKLAACLVQVEGLADRVKIIEGDIFKEDFKGASVVTLYLLEHLNLCVRHRILALEPGTRVVSHQYTMGDWTPEESFQILGRKVHFWVVPARVDGEWDFQDSQGKPFVIDLHQTFGTLSGEITEGGLRAPILSATMHGRELRFTFEAAGTTVKFSGTAHGGDITGVLLSGTAARTAAGRLRGNLRGAPWAEMRPGCERYYGR
jgi:SAM-dependent methyltransferase